MGIVYLGYALHPIQDYYAHTYDYVYYSKKTGWYFHAPKSADNPNLRWDQVLLTENITKIILSDVYNTYSCLFV